MSAYLLLCTGALLFGSIIGSFLNALSFRFNTGRSIARGRSRCMHCNHELGVPDLIPVFSYFFLKGRCRYCSVRISTQYPLVEVAAALLSLLVFLEHGSPLAYLFWLLVWMTLLFVVVYDLRHTVIPWSASGLLIILSFLSLFISFDSTPVFLHAPSVWALLAGPLLSLPLTALSAVSHGRWMGWGDGVLELSLGWFLGLTVGLTALMCAFWLGAFVGVALIVLQKRFTRQGGGFTMKSELPFAPFLVCGAALAYFYHVDFFQTLPLLW